MKGKRDFSGLKKLAPFLKTYRGMFAAMIVCTVLVGVFNTILPLFQQYAFDNFIANDTLEGLAPFIVLYILCLLVTMALDYVASFDCCKLEMYLLRDMRRAAFNHLQTLSVSYFSANSVGRVHARVMSDTSAIGSIISWDVYQGGWNVTYVISAVIIMLALDPLLALCVIVVVPLVAVASCYFQRRLTVLNRRVREINSEITGGFNEGITGVQTAKTLAIEDRLDARFSRNTARMHRQGTKLGHNRALFYSIIAFASSAALALVLWYGGVLTAENAVKLGTLTVFMTYAQGIMSPVQWSVDAIADLIAVKVNAERLSALLSTESDVKDTPEVTAKYGDTFDPKRENWEPLYGDVEFRDVTFRYPDGEENVLEHFNLKVPKGTLVAIVGETGAGKSTLVNLVCRFYEPTEGQVLIDGRDARERSVGWLHSHIGYVLQTPHLFSGTVRENLLYGNETATQAQLEEACASVNADKVIARLENGYDSCIGEDGCSLSTGEKQLLSFARAILADPAIFVLDEATSSIDTITEKLIQQAIEKLMRGRTSFVIAHRLSTIRSADVILAVHGGKIVESGTHEELIKRRGYYYGLYIKQFREEKLRRQEIIP
ncbi:MAG TPA: ABC transporter ATP-binding protein [Candidatus Coproplasma avistercoris]|nr:ABC transporter ATP-binding protein [Candidatus Coproplasma avistercoris]